MWQGASTRGFSLRIDELFPFRLGELADQRRSRVECGGGRSFKMPPKRVTRSGGPPQSAAVVNPTKSSSKKKKRARQAGTTQGASPISSGTTAGATEDAGDAHFLHLSRLAKDLRDAAVGHPGAQGVLLDFLKKNWTPQGGDEVPFPSTPTNKHLSDSYEEQDDYVE